MVAASPAVTILLAASFSLLGFAEALQTTLCTRWGAATRLLLPNCCFLSVCMMIWPRVTCINSHTRAIESTSQFPRWGEHAVSSQSSQRCLGGTWQLNKKGCALHSYASELNCACWYHRSLLGKCFLLTKVVVYRTAAQRKTLGRQEVRVCPCAKVERARCCVGDAPQEM